jgi:hypothetical protein
MLGKNFPQKREERIGCSSQKAISLARYTVTAEAVAPGQGCRRERKEVRWWDREVWKVHKKVNITVGRKFKNIRYVGCE